MVVSATELYRECSTPVPIRTMSSLLSRKRYIVLKRVDVSRIAKCLHTVPLQTLSRARTASSVAAKWRSQPRFDLL